MWINKGWAVRDTEQVLLLLFSPVKWFQVQHMKEHIGLNFPHCEYASLKDKGWQMFIRAKINDSLFKNWISNQPFHHWWLPPLFHLHPESSGGKTKQNRSICQGSEAKMNTIKESSQQFLPNECNGKEILKEDWAGWAWLDVCLRVAERQTFSKRKGWAKLSYRGEDSFWRLRGEGEGLRECECRRRLPTSPFFTFDLLGLSSSEEDEEPESANTEESLSGKWSLWHWSLPGWCCSSNQPPLPQNENPEFKSRSVEGVGWTKVINESTRDG